MTVEQCAVGSDLQERMLALIDNRVRADDSTKIAEKPLSAVSTFAAMKEFSAHRTNCRICKRQRTGELCPEGERLAEKFLNVAHNALKKSEVPPNDSMLQASVSAALSEFLRHRDRCSVCAGEQVS